ncbi:unnamed protein product [Brachionus calyciflorus]|uniref:G-protein coupled receptors family 1 profile domain-containing protein n=1 Tax=Brachionus calyciflorus TaxID=104777 RepID=A0A813MKH0_9BILA|nr:unnamed protein product [Brachionus calyciflorus]
MGFYNKCIGCANIIQLLFFMFIQNSEVLFNYNLLLTSNHMCKIIYYFRRIFRQLTPIIETTMTFDRFINIYFPNRFSFINKKSFIISLILLLIFIFGVVDLLNLSYNLQVRLVYSNDYTVKNVTKCTSSKTVRQYTDIGATILRTVIPFCTMLILNGLILKQLLVSKNKAHFVLYGMDSAIKKNKD